MIKRRNYKVIALTLTFLMLFASVASAAIPTDSVIIGDKAYSIGYVTNPANAAEIQAALDNLGTGQLAYNIDGQTSGWTSIMGGTPLTADQITALPPITYKNDAGEVSNYAAGDGDLIPSGTSLSVSSVSVVNRSAIEVTFDKAVDAVAVANFSLSKGTVKTVGLNTAKTVATLGVEGLDYEDVVTVTVSNVTAGDATLTSYSKEITIPAFGEFYKVQVTAEDDVILADGLSKTMVTAKIIDKVANKPVIVDGLVTFTTTKGDFAQPQVSFDQNGVAALQLTSEVSTSVITAFITATVTNVPGATEYEGLVGQYQVRFAPAEEMQDQLKMVSIVAVNASQADRINVVFSDDVSAADIIAQYPTFTLAQADNFGFDIDTFGKSSLDVIITNIEQVNAKTIRLILDTDNKFVNGGAGTSELRFNYLARTGSAFDVEANLPVPGALNGAYLRDNMTHNVSVPFNIGTKVVANTIGLDFLLTDISKPWIAGVDVINQMTLDVRFSEAMAEDLVEKIETVGGNDLYKNFRIDGKRLMKIAGASSTAPERTAAINNNYILVKDVYVNPYWLGTDAVDNRDIITILIDPWNKLAAGTYSIQASNVGDWAAMSHSANMLETQTFDFTVEADTQVPTATLQVQSPEQWLITFDRPVKIADAKELKDALKIYTKEEYAKATPTALTMTNAVAPVKHYQVTAINKDGIAILGAGDGIAPIATNAAVNGVERLLIEFKQDWTVEYNTAVNKINYFHSTKSPYVVVLDHWVHDVTENAMANTVLSAATPLDAVSPTITNATDMNEILPLVYNNGEAVFVEMSEPVQLRNAGDTVVSTPLTESQQQALGAGIPIPTFEFVKGDTVIPGSLSAGSIPQDDFNFIVEPDTPLTAGTWTLIIRSISDDVGNTSATVTRDFVVEEAVGAETDTRISWIGFDNGPTAHDYIFIKFTKEMKSTDANGVSRTTNYSLNNNPLPTGSEIIKGIKDLEGNAILNTVQGTVYANVTNNWDGVTIKLPKTAWDGTPDGGTTNFTCAVGVASNFKAADGEALTGPYTVELTHLGTNSTADADFDFEALYENNIQAVTNLILGNAIIAAVATDTDFDGKIERISLYDYTRPVPPKAKIAGLAAGHEILVNGVAFTSDGTDYVSATGVNTTAANGLKITSTSGALIVNTGNVLDLAAPVVITAVGAVGSKLVTVTFSEAVIGSDIAPNAGDILPVDLAYTDVSLAGATSIASVGTHTAPVTSVVVTLDADLVAGDIGVDKIGAAATIKDLAPTPNTGAGAGKVITN